MKEIIKSINQSNWNWRIGKNKSKKPKADCFKKINKTDKLLARQIRKNRNKLSALGNKHSYIIKMDELL